MLLNNRTALDEYRELYKNAVDAQKKRRYLFVQVQAA